MTLAPPASRQVPPHQKLKRLIRTRDYSRVYRQGQHVKARFLRLYYAPNLIEHCRLGVVVSKRISKKATERNWYKRVLKEGFRQCASIVPGEHSDIIIVVTKAARTTPHGSAELRKELATLIQQVFK